MEDRMLGKSGLKVTRVGLGCNNFGWRMEFDASRKVIHKALDLGITLFDTADIYGRGASEEMIGQCLGVRRKEVVLATKFGQKMDDAGTLRGGSRRYIMAAAEASLKRLKTDWIDLYQIHCPDPATPIEETLRALDDLVRQGKVRYVGCSKFAAWQLVEAQWTSRHLNLNAFISCQDEYSLLKRGLETSLAPAMTAYGVGLIPFSPLANGLLTGKYRRDAPLPAGARITDNKKLLERWLSEGNWATIGRLDEFCKQRGHSMLELAFSWLASRPSVASIIAGASTPGQLALNARAADWQLLPDDIAEIDRLTLAGEPAG